MKRRLILTWSSLLYPVANTGKGKSPFISFDLARVLHYLSASQQALKSKKKANGASQRTNFKYRKVRMDTMKKTLVSLACTLALALGASAQTISFAELPAVTTPTVLPDNFASLNWSGFYYVAPTWTAAGAGFRQGPAALNVAFMGGGSLV
jgi:hypothetical protein